MDVRRVNSDSHIFFLFLSVCAHMRVALAGKINKCVLAMSTVRKYRRDTSEVSCCLKYAIFGFNVMFWVSANYYIHISIFWSIPVDLQCSKKFAFNFWLSKNLATLTLLLTGNLILYATLMCITVFSIIMNK